MKKIYAEFENPDDPEGDKNVVFDLTPDVADALREGLGNVREVGPPVHAKTFEDLTETLAQMSRLIQHLEAKRDLTIVAADETGPHADRQAIGIAAGMFGSRLYRVLEKHGRPRNRAKADYVLDDTEAGLRYTIRERDEEPS